MAKASFQTDPQIAKIAEAYALDAVDLASSNFGITLDWSDASVRQVEQMLGRLHDQLAAEHPPEDQVWTFAKAFGSYVGEVLRRHHGGEWGEVGIGEETFPGLRQPNETLCWPWARAHNRLVKGPEDNVWHYYRALTRPADQPEVLEEMASQSPLIERGAGGGGSPKKSWWRFW